ncbi:salicylate hydroxylase [Xylariomycetidae sp. FL2044]|nr:salicylate hydroxylase [Xylariomycetidae sp. FL2044]
MSGKTTPKIDLAIIGGGLAGASLANAMMRIPHISVQVFESAPEFSARGAAVGLAVNAQKALRRVVPDADQLLERAGAVPMNSSRAVIGSGPDAGTVINDVGVADPGKNVHRAALLRELLATIPSSQLHANKKLASITQDAQGKVELCFEDGTRPRFDAVIGADGIFSSVRDFVLQDAANEYAAKPAGFWDSRNLVPYQKAVETLGAEYFREDRQYGWAGDGGFLMHDILDNRTTVHIYVGGLERDSTQQRKRPLTREFLMESLSSWIDGPIAKGMIDLILDQESPHRYSQWEHLSTPTYCHGHVCIVGDAAHSSTPYMGSGVGMAIEDAMILKTLLSNISGAGELAAAFKAFDSVRRDRCQRVVHASRRIGEVFYGIDPQVGLDPEKLRGVFATSWNFIYELEPEAHEREALEKLKGYQEG